MSEYQAIKGVKVKTASSDPANINLGDVWYNTTTNTFKARIYSSGWASGNNILTPAGPGIRQNGAGGGGGSSCFFFGGYRDDAPYTWTNTQNFDGTSWSNSGEYPWSWQGNGGTGASQSTGIGFCGYQRPGYPPIGNKAGSATYNGTSWTAVNDMPTTSGGARGTGTDSLALAWALADGPATRVCAWDGTCWTNTVDQVSGGPSCAKGYSGTKTSAFMAGTPSTGSETWNDTCWSASGTVTACNNGGTAGASNSDGLVWGGNTNQNDTSSFDGTSWSAKGNLVIASGDYGGAAGISNTAAWSSGGTPTPTAGLATQLYTEGGATQTITTS